MKRNYLLLLLMFSLIFSVSCFESVLDEVFLEEEDKPVYPEGFIFRYANDSGDDQRFRVSEIFYGIDDAATRGRYDTVRVELQSLDDDSGQSYYFHSYYHNFEFTWGNAKTSTNNFRNNVPTRALEVNGTTYLNVREIRCYEDGEIVMTGFFSLSHGLVQYDDNDGVVWSLVDN